ILDLAAVAALELRADDLVDVEEAVLLEADLDERRLHAEQDVVDAAEVDVAGDRAALRPLEVDLRDLIVLEHRDTLLADVDRDDELALRLGQRCAALGLATAASLLAAALLPLRDRLALARLALGLAGRGLARRRFLVGRRRGRRSGRRGGLLAPAAAAATAASLGLGGIGCGGRAVGCGRLDYVGLGPSLDRGCGHVGSRF